MKRTLLLFGVCAMTASIAFAAPQEKAAKAKPAAAPTTIVCAVEPDHKVDIKAATAAKKFADYKGNRYFFCCAACPGAFKATPEKFAKNAHIKTPAAAPAKAKAKA